MTNGKIGFFDSGFGGLSVMREVVKTLPKYDYIYLGDTVHAPFGPKTKEEVVSYTLSTLEFLFDKGCQLVILACNTSSSQSLTYIQQVSLPAHYPDKKVLGVVRPAAEEAVDKSAGRIGIMATTGTVNSKIYETEIKKLSLSAHVFQQACPELVDLIEAGQINSSRFDTSLKGCTEQLIKSQVDTVILGCTHYALAAVKIKQVFGPGVSVLDQGPIVAAKLANYLLRHTEIENKLGHNSSRQFFSTRADEHFNKHSVFYGAPVTANQVDLKGLK